VGRTGVLERPNHCFISYASEDLSVATMVAEWLTLAGLRVWFDQTRLNTGAPVLDALAQELGRSRSCVLILSPQALTKNYVKYEVDLACQQQITQPGFSVLALRTDASVDPTARFPALTNVSWGDLPGGRLDLAAARRLLLSITQGVPKAPNARHVFVSCGWGENEQPVTRRVCAPLAARGVRLVGDAMDQGNFGEDGKARVQRIMSGCTGHLLVLPRRQPVGKSPEEAYKYFLAEWELGQRLGLTRRTFCVSQAVLPMVLQKEAVEVGSAENTAAFEPALVELHDETEPVAPYVFLATDFNRLADRNAAARDIVEHVLGAECWMGNDYPAEQLREAIVDKIRQANVVFADVASLRDAATNRLVPNLNTCIEAGIAMGAGRPLFVSALDPASFDPTVKERTTQVPFMFRNSQIQWYGGDEDFLARVHRLARMMRRRIINDELADRPN
jgi:hypothetical protein